VHRTRSRGLRARALSAVAAVGVVLGSLTATGAVATPAGAVGTPPSQIQIYEGSSPANGLNLYVYATNAESVIGRTWVGGHTCHGTFSWGSATCNFTGLSPETHYDITFTLTAPSGAQIGWAESFTTSAVVAPEIGDITIHPSYNSAWASIKADTNAATVHGVAQPGNHTCVGEFWFDRWDNLNQASCSFSGLHLETTYTATFEVTGHDGGTSTRTMTFVTGGPEVPDSLNGSILVSSKGATVSWEPPADGGSPILGYRISYYEPGNKNQFQYAIVGPNATSLELPSFIYGDDDYMIIQAFNAQGFGASTCISTYLTEEFAALQEHAPDAPTDPVAVAGNGSATVSWGPAVVHTNEPITRYRVLTYDNTIRNGWVAHSCVTTGALSCTVTGLTNGVVYDFKVQAQTATRVSEKSTWSNQVVPEGLNLPIEASAVGSNASAIVSWTAATPESGATITGYTVTAFPGEHTCHTTTALSCTVTGLVNGHPYTFEVTPYQDGHPSLPAEAEATPATVPDAPRLPFAALLPLGVGVLFGVPHNGGSPITGYTVTASPGGATCTSGVTTTNSEGCIVVGLTSGTYTFTVVATNAIGDSLPSVVSNPVTITGDPVTTPAPAFNISATAGRYQATVTWSAATSTNPITGYTVTASPGGKTCSTTGALSCVVTGLASGLPVTFTVTTLTATENSAPSEPATATPYGAKPSAKIYFDLDKSIITPQQNAKLKAFAKAIVANHVTAVSLHGFADPQGNAAYNLKLSFRRGQVVARQLTNLVARLGGTNLTVTVVGRGVKSTHANHALNRVVEASTR